MEVLVGVLLIGLLREKGCKQHGHINWKRVPLTRPVLCPTKPLSSELSARLLSLTNGQRTAEVFVSFL